jgi:hypothetical protein
MRLVVNSMFLTHHHARFGGAVAPTLIQGNDLGGPYAQSICGENNIPIFHWISLLGIPSFGSRLLPLGLGRGNIPSKPTQVGAHIGRKGWSRISSFHHHCQYIAKMG